MLFLLLTRVLLWLLIGTLAYYVLLKLVPKAYYTWLGGIFLAVILVLAFFNPYASVVSEAWRILSFPLKPLGLGITFIWGGTRQQDDGAITTVGKRLIFTGLAILLLASNPIVAYNLAQQAELEAIVTEKRIADLCDEICPADVVPLSRQTAHAIVLLGQGTTQAPLPYRTRVELTDRGDLVFYTAQLYWGQRGLSNDPFVIVSAGPRPDLDGDLDDIVEAYDIQQVLESLGVPPENIILEKRGIDLRTSAQAVDEILRDKDLGNRIILVTPAINTLRARFTFANLGIQAITRPTDFITFESVTFQPGPTPRKRIHAEDFIPSTEALLITNRVADEYLARIYYFLRGWFSLTIVS